MKYFVDITEKDLLELKPLKSNWYFYLIIHIPVRVKSRRLIYII